MSITQIDANRSKEEVFEDIEKIMDTWVGIHRECDYVVLCTNCNMNAGICSCEPKKEEIQ